jgi:hypothetical protein
MGIILRDLAFLISFVIVILEASYLMFNPVLTLESQ